MDLTNRAAIEFRNVSYRLNGGADLLRNLNLEIHRGETLVLLGRSGSGKTTTLKLINHLLTATEGEIRVDGRPLREWDVIRLRRMIGYVIQEAGLFPHYTVERNIGLVPKIEGWPAERIRERVQELLQLVGLEPQTGVALSARTFRRTAAKSRSGTGAGGGSSFSVDGRALRRARPPDPRRTAA